MSGTERQYKTLRGNTLHLSRYRLSPPGNPSATGKGCERPIAKDEIMHIDGEPPPATRPTEAKQAAERVYINAADETQLAIANIDTIDVLAGILYKDVSALEKSLEADGLDRYGDWRVFRALLSCIIGQCSAVELMLHKLEKAGNALSEVIIAERRAKAA